MPKLTVGVVTATEAGPIVREQKSCDMQASRCPCIRFCQDQMRTHRAHGSTEAMALGAGWLPAANTESYGLPQLYCIPEQPQKWQPAAGRPRMASPSPRRSRFIQKGSSTALHSLPFSSLDPPPCGPAHSSPMPLLSDQQAVKHQQLATGCYNAMDYHNLGTSPTPHPTSQHRAYSVAQLDCWSKTAKLSHHSGSSHSASHGVKLFHVPCSVPHYSTR